MSVLIFSQRALAAMTGLDGPRQSGLLCMVEKVVLFGREEKM